MKNFVPVDDENGPKDAFLAVMGKDYDGRRRLYGRGVCIEKLKKLNGTSVLPYVVPGEILESVRASMLDDMQKNVGSEMTKLQDMRREMEEDHLKKKAELENMKKDIDNQRDNMTEDIMRKILGKLPPEIATQYFS